MNNPSPLAGEGDSAPLRRAGRGVFSNPARAHAKAMRSAMTDAEAEIWRMLRAKRFAAYKFRRQVPIGPFIVDFVCFSARLIVEADGSQHIESAADERRTAWLEAQGYAVLRYWNGEVLRHPDAVAHAIYTALTNPSPRSPAASRPLPQGERERKSPDDR